MRILDLIRPEASTIAFGNRIANLLYRVLLVTIAIVILGAVAVLLGYLVNIGADFAIRYGAQGLYVLLVIASWLFALADQLRLLFIYLTDRDDQDENQ